MGTHPYEWTSGRKLHHEGCLHFYDDKPPHRATEEELRTLPVCNTCAGTGASGSSEPTRFTCPNCGLSLAVSVRQPSGLCRDCD